jgi:hypothetical protein
VPPTWSTGTEVRELWNAEGYIDSDVPYALPAGDLVDWFVRFPHHAKKDVPDTLALVDATDRKTDARICYWVRPSRKREVVSPKRAVRTHNSGRAQVGYGQRFYDKCHKS